LIMRSESNAEFQVGKWGRIAIVPGYYIYVGSAFGPGGVRARILRHCRVSKPKHWHIDYLSDFVNPISAWYSYEQKKLEHKWAQVFSEMSETTPIKGFGCSDCNCYTHLFATSAKPDLERFPVAVGGGIKTWLYLTSCRQNS